MLFHNVEAPFWILQDPKKKKRLEKLAKGPAFLAHRVACEKKMQEKEAALGKLMKATKEKLMDARQGAEKLKNEGDNILLSYFSNVVVALDVVSAWEAEVDLDACPAYDFGFGSADAVQPAAWTQISAPDSLEAAEGKLRACVQSPKAGVQLVKDANLLHIKQYIGWARKTLLRCECINMVEAIVAASKDDASCIEQLIRSLSKVASDMKSYLAQKARQAERDEAKKKKEAEKEEVAKATALAKAEASKVKKAAKGHNVPEVFLVDASEWATMNERANLDAPMDAEAMDAPWILQGSPAVVTWKNTRLMALKLSEFAAGYKKAATFKTEGKAQAAVLPKNGKEECQVMFDKLVDEKALVNISSVKGGDSFMSNIWHWGMESKLAGAWLSPNCAAQIKIVAMGSVTMIAFELKQLIDILGEKCTCDDLTKFVLGLSKESPHWGAVHGVRAEVKADSAVYIPQGWVVAEQACGNVLIHGVRKSFLVKRENAKVNYECAVGLLERSGRDPSKMKEVLACYAS